MENSVEKKNGDGFVHFSDRPVNVEDTAIKSEPSSDVDIFQDQASSSKLCSSGKRLHSGGRPVAGPGTPSKNRSKFITLTGGNTMPLGYQEKVHDSTATPRVGTDGHGTVPGAPQNINLSKKWHGKKTKFNNTADSKVLKRKTTDTEMVEPESPRSRKRNKGKKQQQHHHHEHQQNLPPKQPRTQPTHQSTPLNHPFQPPTQPRAMAQSTSKPIEEEISPVILRALNKRLSDENDLFRRTLEHKHVGKRSLEVIKARIDLGEARDEAIRLVLGSGKL